MKIEFFHEFTPPTATAQGRRQNTHGGYQHAAGRNAKAIFQAIFEKHVQEKPLRGALVLKVVATWPHTKESAQRARKTGRIAVPKTTRPDGDNYLKLLKDAVMDAGLIVDDANIYDEQIKRYYGELPGISVQLWEEDNGE